MIKINSGKQLFRLLPFSLEEVFSFENNSKFSLHSLLYSGFYPRILVQDQNPSEAYSFYFNTYIERDVRRILKVQNLRLFEIFVKICAGRTGQLLNYSTIADETGVDQKTVQRWLSVLETGYIVKIVSPYYRNLNKRLTKMPKLYFYDTGLACYLLGIRKPEHLACHPLFGAIFETYAVGELLKKAYNNIRDDDLYFFRDNRGREVDIVHDRATSVDLMEIKSGSTVNSSFFKGLKYLEKLPVEIHSSHLVYGGEESYEREGVRISGWKHIPEFE